MMLKNVPAFSLVLVIILSITPINTLPWAEGFPASCGELALTSGFPPSPSHQLVLTPCLSAAPAAFPQARGAAGSQRPAGWGVRLITMVTAGVLGKSPPGGQGQGRWESGPFQPTAARAGGGALGMNHQDSDPASKAPWTVFLNPFHRGEDRGHGQESICPKFPGRYLTFGITFSKSVQIGRELYGSKCLSCEGLKHYHLISSSEGS